MLHHLLVSQWPALVVAFCGAGAALYFLQRMMRGQEHRGHVDRLRRRIAE